MVIESMTVQSNATLLRTSFAACAATPDTWQEIVQIDRGEPIGEMMIDGEAGRQLALALGMLLTENMRYILLLVISLPGYLLTVYSN